MSLSLPELSPDPRIVDVLRGVISEPIKVGPDEDDETVNLALEGPGMFGLTNWEDNKTWSGIFNHCVLSARYALRYAEGIVQAGYPVNPQLILDGMIVSHPGRRQWDEAGLYPQLIPDAAAKRAISNETLGLRLIQGKVPEDVFNFVAGLAYSDEFPVGPEVLDSWEHRLSILADHRTSDRYLPLHVRMGGFIVGNFFRKKEATKELTGRVNNTLGDLLSRQRNYRLGINGGLGVTVDEAVETLQSMGAMLKSPRSTLGLQLGNLLQDAETEAELIKVGVDPDNVNDQTVPMPAWEARLRYEYVEAARESVVERLSNLFSALENEYMSARVTEMILWRIDADFPRDTWWGEYAWGMYNKTLRRLSDDSPAQFVSPAQ